MNAIVETRLDELEAVIQRGFETFVEVGNALAEIRDNKLYRKWYGTFDEYCRERWGFKKGYANYQIKAAKTFGNLVTTVAKNDDVACRYREVGRPTYLPNRAVCCQRNEKPQPRT